MAADVQETTCCVVGGGPAGMMLGYLLARRGVEVTVLEKHQDFFRDFRGDTVHPSTMEVLKELGLLEEFLSLPHQKVTSAGLLLGGMRFNVADFRHLPATCKFVALMPQWDFLNFLADHAKRLASFRLLMGHEATWLVREGESIRGVAVRHEGQDAQIRAELVVGCDGRHSVTRNAAGLDLIESGVPVDVLWFRISREPNDPANVLGNVNYGKALILIDRSDYYQAGLIIKKGTYDEVRARGLGALRDDIGKIAPFLSERASELRDWEQIKVLTVQINRLRRWHRPGLLCIGDAAHAMSPAGGVGINLAIQDAVATANLLSQHLLEGRVPESALAAVQHRREFPTRLTQAIQFVAHRGFAKVFEDPGPIQPPWQMKAATRIPGIHRALGYAVGIGARPEHVRDERQAKRPKLPRLATVAYFGIGVTAAAMSCGWSWWMRRRAA